MGRKKKRYTRYNLPPCPDPDRFELAQDAGGFYWKLKRGAGKRAKLNEVLDRNKGLTGATNRAAAALVRRLGPFLHGMRRQHLNGRIAGALKRSINQSGSWCYAAFPGFEWQKDHPLHHLLESPVKAETREGQVRIEIPLYPGAVRALNTLVTEFYFDAILLSGDPLDEDSLRTDHCESPLYALENSPKTVVEMNVDVPGSSPWLLFLKISCLEGNELGVHPKLYGMKVVAVG